MGSSPLLNLATAAAAAASLILFLGAAHCCATTSGFVVAPVEVRRGGLWRQTAAAVATQSAAVVVGADRLQHGQQLHGHPVRAAGASTIFPRVGDGFNSPSFESSERCDLSQGNDTLQQSAAIAAAAAAADTVLDFNSGNNKTTGRGITTLPSLSLSPNVRPTRPYELTMMLDPAKSESELKVTCAGYVRQLKKMGAVDIVVVYRGKKLLFGKLKGGNMGKLVDIGFRVRPGGIHFLRMRLKQDATVFRFMINKPLEVPWKKVLRVWRTGRGPKSNRPDIIGILPYQKILQERGYDLKMVEEMLAQRKDFV